MESEVENLKAENKALRIENTKLKKRLGLNSKNSSSVDMELHAELGKNYNQCMRENSIQAKLIRKFKAGEQIIIL